MNIRFFHIDAFCDQLLSGNPAMVCLLPQWLEAEHLQRLAAEHYLPVTAFIMRIEQGYTIRWFTPEIELELCGHGTLAAVFVILTILLPTQSTVNLYSAFAGEIAIYRRDTLLAFDFPLKKSVPVDCDPTLNQALNAQPESVFQCGDDRLMIVLANETLVKDCVPNITALKALPYRGIIVCALSNSVDFVSRTFYPNKAIAEDAVTGASHCYLAPYFAKRLNKSSLEARQVSLRGGHLWIDIQADHITIKAQAVLYAEGIICLN